MVTGRIVLTAILLAICLAPPALLAQGTDFESKMKDADALMARRQWQDALRIYKDANALQDKKSPRAQLGMARAYQGLRAHKSAAEICNEALKHVGGDTVLEAEARNLRGTSLFALAEKPDDKRWKQAEEDFRAVLAMSDAHPVARYNLGVTLLKQQRDDEGIRELSAFIETNGGATEAPSARKFVANPRRARENYAPEFALTTLDGEYLTSEDLLGKVVLIDFWATWCPPCLAATPGLKKIQSKFKDEPFVILGVSADRQQAPWREFVDSNKLSWPQFYDGRRVMATGFGVNSYPTYILIDHEGIIRFHQQGWNPRVDGMIESEARTLIRKLRAIQ
jgi:thiol-disulfide isomerase/thioredoxin